MNFSSDKVPLSGKDHREMLHRLWSKLKTRKRERARCVSDKLGFSSERMIDVPTRPSDSSSRWRRTYRPLSRQRDVSSEPSNRIEEATFFSDESTD
jgi:hypothetical protein